MVKYNHKYFIYTMYIVMYNFFEEVILIYSNYKSIKSREKMKDANKNSYFKCMDVFEIVYFVFSISATSTHCEIVFNVINFWRNKLRTNHINSCCLSIIFFVTKQL